MRTKISLILFALLLAAAACGDDSDDTALVPGSGETLPDPVCIQETDDLEPDYVGLSEAEATELAEGRGLSVRVVGVDGECFAITMDLRDDRVNLELADDVVIAAAIY